MSECLEVRCLLLEGIADDLVCSYRKTLNYNETISDEEEERSKLLKACHQRCANRTLKVLERNGSIFIKLGQHLVSGLRPWFIASIPY